MSWIVKFSPEADNGISKLDNSLVVQVFAGINKVSSSPLTSSEWLWKTSWKQIWEQSNGFLQN